MKTQALYISQVSCILVVINARDSADLIVQMHLKRAFRGTLQTAIAILSLFLKYRSRNLDS